MNPVGFLERINARGGEALVQEVLGIGLQIKYEGCTSLCCMQDVFWLGPPAPKVMGAKHISNPDFEKRGAME